MNQFRYSTSQVGNADAHKHDFSIYYFSGPGATHKLGRCIFPLYFVKLLWRIFLPGGMQMSHFHTPPIVFIRVPQSGILLSLCSDLASLSSFSQPNLSQYSKWFLQPKTHSSSHFSAPSRLCLCNRRDM